jgi:murein DD-endopeptidase MepM/ murein hydrolase activator NlpD
MSGFAKGIRPGSRVQQGQVIGFVGNTGISTGPHCHFEFYENGRFIDPLRKKFPSADPVPEALLAQFKSEAIHLLASLPPWGEFSITAQDTNQ